MNRKRSFAAVAGRPFKQAKWYVGWPTCKRTWGPYKGTKRPWAFKAWSTPTEESHKRFSRVLGPMSKRAAVWFVMNPTNTCRTAKELDEAAKRDGVTGRSWVEALIEIS